MSFAATTARLTVLLSCGLYSFNAVSESAPEITSAHPPLVEHAPVEHVPVEHMPVEPEKVYVETGTATYRGTRSDEHCFYNEEHDHIHCYDRDPGQLQDRVVYVENRTYRSTRYRRPDPIATGIGVGVAIGLPILVHHAVHDRSRYRSGYRYGSHHFRQDFRQSHRYDRHGRYNRHDRHDRHHKRRKH